MRERAEAEEREQRERQEAVERAALEELERRRLEALRLAEESAVVDSPLETVDELSFSADGESSVICDDCSLAYTTIDVFAVRTSSSGLSPEMSELGSRIFSFRKRLRSMEF